ncbi:MAG TPA: amylo-alpha-1,6-glucosidase, partial [Dehalococcoidia bacterium]|nr:amylo-alpha-1,6-glucosidase [Dehalococcoidia bacterium]
EVQGYVYDAKCRLAELLEATGDQSGADELRTAAEGLRRRFEEAFWLPEAGFYALALDGRKRRVDSITSNVGHCLWSGIVAPDRGARIAERLLAPDMFTGWGIRTMSSEMRAYNPISYHNGSVWPHDTSLVAAGLARYGFRREAGAVLRGLIDATGRLDRHRPPEVFAGFPRRRRGFPPAYRTANAPQAWATGAIILAIRLLLGAEPGAASIATSPIEGAPGLRLTGVDYRGRKVTVGSAD